MSQDVNQDWANREFVEQVEIGIRKCVDFLNNFHESARYRISEIDQRLTSLERKLDFTQAQLANCDPSKRGAQPKPFKNSVFDPEIRRQLIAKQTERQEKSVNVFTNQVIAPKKSDFAKMIVGNARKDLNAKPINTNVPISNVSKDKDQDKGNDVSNGSRSPPTNPQVSPSQNKPPPIQPSPPSQPPSSQPLSQPPPPQPPQSQPSSEPKSQPQAPPPPRQPQPPQQPQSQPQPPQPPQEQKIQPQAPPPPKVPQPPQQPNDKQANDKKDDDEPGQSGDTEGGGQKKFPHGKPDEIDVLVIEPTNGDKPQSTSKVEIEYTGFLANGDEFISHREEIVLGKRQNIKGLELGVCTMNVGSKVKLWIPSKLGYGPKGAPGLIPPDTDLTFEIVLHKIIA